MKKRLVEYAKLIRLPGLGGLSVPVVFGALSVEASGIFELSLLFLMGALTIIYGFVLNDYVDYRLDKLSKDLSDRPLVSGTVSRKAALSIIIFSFVAVFLIAFRFFLNSLAIIILTISYILGTIYNLFGKKFVGSDVFVSGAMALLCLFGALAVTNPNEIGGLTWVMMLLAFNQTFFVNAVEGGLKDADHDYLMNVKNIASSVGVKVENGKVRIPWLFKSLGIGVRTFSAVLIFIPFLFLNLKFELWQIGVIAIFLTGTFYASIKMLTIKVFDRKKLRRLISAQAFLRYSAVPFIFIDLIGVLGVLTLVLLPISWYIIFTKLVNGKLFQPTM